jgi:hypothetical protein
MPSTTPFLDLEARLFTRDRDALDRDAMRFVLGSAAGTARRRHTTDRYRVVAPRRPPLGHADGETTVVRSNEAALVFAARGNAA